MNNSIPVYKRALLAVKQVGWVVIVRGDEKEKRRMIITTIREDNEKGKNKMRKTTTGRRTR